MNVLKNFEAVFIVTLGLVFAADFALQAPAQDQFATPEMQVVVVSAKRLSAEQKRQSLIDENKTTLATDVATSTKI